MDNPAAIPSLLRKGMLKDLDINNIYPYLKCRDDFYTADLPRLLGIRAEDFNSSESGLIKNKPSNNDLATMHNGYEAGLAKYGF